MDRQRPQSQSDGGVEEICAVASPADAADAVIGFALSRLLDRGDKRIKIPLPLVSQWVGLVHLVMHCAKIAHPNIVERNAGDRRIHDATGTDAMIVGIGHRGSQGANSDTGFVSTTSPSSDQIIEK